MEITTDNNLIINLSSEEMLNLLSIFENKNYSETHNLKIIEIIEKFSKVDTIKIILKEK